MRTQTTNQKTIEDLKLMRLSEVSDLYYHDWISRELAQEYVNLWNAGPHFTIARLSHSTIVLENEAL